jgi:hypothetical protein
MRFHVETKTRVVSSLAVVALLSNSCVFGPPWPEEISSFDLDPVEGLPLRAEVWCIASKPGWDEQLRLVLADREISRYSLRESLDIAADCRPDHPDSLRSVSVEREMQRIKIQTTAGKALALPLFVRGVFQEPEPEWSTCVEKAFGGSLKPQVVDVFTPKPDWRWTLSEMPGLHLSCSKSGGAWAIQLLNKELKKSPFPELLVTLKTGIATQEDCEKESQLVRLETIQLGNGVLRLEHRGQDYFLPWVVRDLQTSAWMECLIQ